MNSQAQKIYTHKMALSYYIHYSVTCFFIQWYGMCICIFFKLSGCNKCTISIQTCSIIFLHGMPMNTPVIQDHDFTHHLYWDEGFPGSSAGKESACNAGDLRSIPRLGNPLEEGMATHSSILAWSIPWTIPWGCKGSDTQLSNFHFLSLYSDITAI